PLQRGFDHFVGISGSLDMPPYCILAGDRAETIPSETKSPLVTSQRPGRSEEHTSELQSRFDLVCRLLPEKKNPAQHAERADQRRQSPREGAGERRAETRDLGLRQPERAAPDDRAGRGDGARAERAAARLP